MGDFHSYVTEKRSDFRAVLCDDTDEVFSQNFTAEQIAYFAIDADPNAKFYRVEVYNVATDTLVGIGNPIWNAES